MAKLRLNINKLTPEQAMNFLKELQKECEQNVTSA
jgi:hypothetical protein